MKSKYGKFLATSAAIFALWANASLADPLKAEVMHWWTSAGESAAVKQLADAYNSAGGQWVDNAIAGSENAIPAAMSRITGGNPPTAMQMTMGKLLDDLVAQGLITNIDDVAKEENFAKILPDTFLKAVTYNGHVYAVPVNNDGQNWLWYNKAILEKAGVAEPKTFDDLFAAMDKIKVQGEVIPLAMGGQSWQQGLTFLTVLLNKEGSETYYKVLRDLDVNAVRSAEFRDAVDAFGRLRDYTDNAIAGREWNVATNMVITGKAAFQFMGVWSKGEYIAAGQTPDKEFGCVLLGKNGEQNFIMAADVFVFPVVKDKKQIEAQKLLAKTLISLDAQVAFNTKKGSVPARLDVDPSKLDACAAKGQIALAKPEQRIPSVDFLASPEFKGKEQDLAAQFFAEKSMTTDQFVEKFAGLVEAEKANR